MAPNWGMVGCGVAMFVTAGAVAIASHTPVDLTNAPEYQAGKASSLQFQWYQPYAGVGKLLSFSLVVVGGVCLRQGLKGSAANNEIGGSDLSTDDSPVPIPLSTDTAPAPAQRQIPVASTATKPSWIKEFENQRSVLIFGAQGSGKTSKAAWLVEQRLNKGHVVEVADPHAAAAQWKGLKVWGRGKNYREINACLRSFVEEANRRYEQRGSNENYDPLKNEPFYTLFCDEMTNWAAEVETEIMKQFLNCCLTDLRKANMAVIIVSHTDKLTGLGGDAAKGKRDLIDESLAKLKCFSEADPSAESGYRPLSKATLSIPSFGAKEVSVPSWMRPSNGYDFSRFGSTDVRARNVVQFPRVANGYDLEKDPWD